MRRSEPSPRAAARPLRCPRIAASAAPTIPLADDLRRGRVLVGEVHDNYAAALGGSRRPAGLFGTAAARRRVRARVLRAARGDRFSRLAALARSWFDWFTTRSAVPGSSRALGWDTMLPTSSCGTRMSASAFGHVGFTGTSLWIDPDRDRYFVLLTNRAYGGGSLDEMRDVRRAFHDALADCELPRGTDRLSATQDLRPAETQISASSLAQWASFVITRPNSQSQRRVVLTQASDLTRCQRPVRGPVLPVKMGG